MSDNPHVSAHRLITAAAVDLYRQLLAPGILTREGLGWLHGKLDPEVPSEVIPDDPAVELLRLDVDTALAAAYGADLADVPGRELPSPEDFFWPRPGG